MSGHWAAAFSELGPSARVDNLLTCSNSSAPPGSSSSHATYSLTRRHPHSPVLYL